MDNNKTLVTGANGFVGKLLSSVVLNAGAKLLGKADVAQRLLGNLQVDITKNKTLLGWQPPFTLQQGLKLTVNDKS